MRCREKETFKYDVVTEDNLEYILKEYYNMDVSGCTQEWNCKDNEGKECIVKFSKNKEGYYIVIYDYQVFEYYDSEYESYRVKDFEFDHYIVKDSNMDDGTGYPLYSEEEFEDKFDVIEE